MTYNLNAERLRGMLWGLTWFEELCPKFTDEERTEHAGIIARSIAEFGVYIKPTLKDTADWLDEATEKIKELKAEVEACEKTIELSETTRQSIVQTNNGLRAELTKQKEALELQVERNEVLQKEADAITGAEGRD